MNTAIIVALISLAGSIALAILNHFLQQRVRAQEERARQTKEEVKQQEERLADINLILPLLLPDREVRHIKNLFTHTTAGYRGNSALRAELRRLRSIGLLAMKPGRTVHALEDGTQLDLADSVALTELGRRWAIRIQEMEGGDFGQKPTPNDNKVA